MATALNHRPQAPRAMSSAASSLARLGEIARELRAMAARRDELTATALTAAGGAETMLATTDDIIGAVTCLKLASLRACEESDRWHQQGYASVEDWRAASSGQGRSAAARDARMARDLAELPRTADALADGTITPEHASVISRFRHNGDKNRRREALAGEAEHRLLKLASEQDAGRFSRNAERVARAIDAEGVRDEFEKVRARRYLRISKRAGGVFGEFFLDPLAGEKVVVGLEAHSARPLKGDERTSEQRAADALCDLAQSALDAGKPKTGALVRPHLSVLLTQDAFAAALARRREQRKGGEGGPTRRSDAGAALTQAHNSPTPTLGPEAQGQPRAGEPANASDPGQLGGPPHGPGAPLAGDDTSASSASGREDPADLNSPNVSAAATELGELLDRAPLAVSAGELEDGTLLPDYLIAALLCDCSIGRLVIDADGQPISVGRDERTASGELRRAVLIRDKTCRFPGCTRPARWCDSHHIEPWARGGETSDKNGIMLCTLHHETFIHAQGVTIKRKPGKFEFHWPDGRLIGSTDHATRLPARRRERARRAGRRQGSASTPRPDPARLPGRSAGTHDQPQEHATLTQHLD